MVLYIDDILQKAADTVKMHELAEGQYARWLWQNAGGTRNLGIDPYGCADAANILYTIGQFPSTEESRRHWIASLQGLQDPHTGLFTDRTHHPIHTTAHCIAALELFETRPVYALTQLEEYASKEGIIHLLESLDWVNDPWDMSHRGAGAYAALVLTDSVDADWQDTYFSWFWENADEETGLWRKGAVRKGDIVQMFPSIAGTFHYLFNHEYAKRPLRYPDRMIDTCLAYYDSVKDNFGLGIGFSQIDWVYCLNRAGRQTAYRFSDSRDALKDFAYRFITNLGSIDAGKDDRFQDLHALFGAVCCLAELQQAIPGVIRSRKPLKLVLDRRPFI